MKEDREFVQGAVSKTVLREKLAEEASHYSVNYRIVYRGEMHSYQANYFRLPSRNGEKFRIIVGFRNVDALQEEERRRQDQLQAALKAAENASRAKTVFLNNMSHDIRTPMNAIIGFTALAESYVDNREQVTDYLKKISVSSQHLLSLINDILDMSRIESGKVKLEETEVHLPEIFHELRTIVQADVSRKHLHLVMNVQDLVDEDVICDKLRISQVLMNLMSNAIKYTPEGGTIHVGIQQHTIADDRAGYEICVRDNGIGMSEAYMENLFKPFERERNATVSGIQGTGLGLAITKNLVEMMGGTIEVESVENVGTEFRVFLELKPVENVRNHVKYASLEGKRVLAIADDFDSRQSLISMLESIDISVDCVASGEEAVLRSVVAMDMDDPYDIILFDITSPDVKTANVVAGIRQRMGTGCPILLLTACDWTEFEAEARRAGVTTLGFKPVFLSEMIQMLTEPYRTESAEEASAEDPDYTGKKILLVEDNELNLEITAELLSDVGILVTTARDGEEAVEIMRRAVPGQFDLVLMDIQMPRMDGYEATRQIRRLEDPAIAQIPIIAMTANAFSEDKEKAMEAGMNRHLSKPVDISKLYETMGDYLG